MEDSEVKNRYEDFLNGFDSLCMSTVDSEGWPLISYAPFVVDDNRTFYVFLTDLMGPGSRLLLICVDYDPSKMSGPPYSVSQNEVKNLFSKKGTLEVLETRNNLEDRMRERGLDWLNETVYLFEKN